MRTNIFKRDISDEIVMYLDTNNILVLHGARQVGKTYILYYLDQYLKDRGEKTHYIDLEDSRLLEMLDRGIDSLLQYLRGEGFDLDSLQTGRKKLYLFIDEIQYLSSPSPLLKLLADHHGYLQPIISGSSSFNIKTKFSDSLVGRTVNFEIYPLTFKEFLRFKNTTYSPEQSTSTVHTARLRTSFREFMSYGGYPKIVLEDSVQRKEKYLLQIVDTYVRKDISDLANITDTKKFNNFLKVLASNSGQLLNITQLSNTCELASNTVRHYLSILENTYIIKLVTPFSSSSKVEVAKTPKIFFFDTGLLQILWLKKILGENIGNVFETSIYAELIKLYGVSNVSFWRNKNQNEIDYILQRKGDITPIEAKYNFGQFKQSKIDPFLSKYHIESCRVVGLMGEKVTTRYLYPWELSHNQF